MKPDTAPDVIMSDCAEESEGMPEGVNNAGQPMQDPSTIAVGFCYGSSDWFVHCQKVQAVNGSPIIQDTIKTGGHSYSHKKKKSLETQGFQGFGGDCWTAACCRTTHALCQPKIRRLTARIFGASWIEPLLLPRSSDQTKNTTQRVVFFVWWRLLDSNQ